MKSKYVVGLLALAMIALIAIGYASSAALLKKAADDNRVDETSDHVAIGKLLTIQNIDSRLTLLSNMDTLSSDGLYYAAWTMGDAEPYENSDGDTVDLYDAQLYLLLGEFKNAQAAQDNKDTWLNAGRTNYEVLREEEVTCGDQAYTLITYNCVHQENPYARGVSAFGTRDNRAVCIELTCRESFEEDLEPVLRGFLENCVYGE